MSEEVDAIIIGAGVIGASIAFELCKRGYRTLNIDKLPAAGYGPTSNSCSIVRAHYSSREGVAMAYEGFFYWQDWPQYVGDDGRIGAGEVHAVGHGAARERHRPPREGAAPLPRPRRRARAVGQRRARAGGSRSTTRGAFWPPKRPTIPHFWDQPARRARRRDLYARARATSTTRSWPRTTCSAPPRRAAAVPVQGRVGEIRQADGRVQRRHADHGAPDRRPGRGQRRRTALVRDQPHGRASSRR